MNKIFKTILSICLVGGIACSFSACGGNDNNKIQKASASEYYENMVEIFNQNVGGNLTLSTEYSVSDMTRQVSEESKSKLSLNSGMNKSYMYHSKETNRMSQGSNSVDSALQTSSEILESWGDDTEDENCMIHYYYTSQKDFSDEKASESRLKTKLSKGHISSFSDYKIINSFTFLDMTGVTIPTKYDGFKSLVNIFANKISQKTSCDEANAIINEDCYKKGDYNYLNLDIDFNVGNNVTSENQLDTLLVKYKGFAGIDCEFANGLIKNFKIVFSLNELKNIESSKDHITTSEEEVYSVTADFGMTRGFEYLGLDKAKFTTNFDTTFDYDVYFNGYDYSMITGTVDTVITTELNKMFKNENLNYVFYTDLIMSKPLKKDAKIMSYGESKIYTYVTPKDNASLIMLLNDVGIIEIIVSTNDSVDLSPYIKQGYEYTMNDQLIEGNTINVEKGKTYKIYETLA